MQGYTGNTTLDKGEFEGCPLRELISEKARSLNLLELRCGMVVDP